MSRAGESGREARPGTRGPVVPTSAAAVRVRPLTGSSAVTTQPGFWYAWQELNRTVTLREGMRRLEEAGNLHNFRLAAGEDEGDYRGPLYLDSDVYKWLEAIAWEQQRRPDPELHARQEEVSALVGRAQQEDGYLNTYVQTGHAERYADLPFGHELFCGGHLLQAAVAQHRGTGSATLLDIAVRYADHLVRTFGVGRLELTDGHPEIETALVELYRETGTTPYLALAEFLVGVRGHGRLATSRFDPDYYQDDVPVRQTDYVRGHAVRAVFLAAGVADLAAELRDDELGTLGRRQWEDLVERKTFVTGGIGARWEGEAFGNAYELGSDVAYAETCAAHASILWSWRMLLASGEARYAELIERTLYNAFLPGLGLDGRTFFYVNALQARPGTGNTDGRSAIRGRQPWYSTACCPPNIMRTLGSLQHYVATRDDDGVQIQQLVPVEIRTSTPTGELGLAVATALPHDGSVQVTITAAPAGPVEVAVRIPTWASHARASVAGERLDPVAGEYLRIVRRWQVGDMIEVELPMSVRVVRADPRIDAVGSARTLERGPLVYCFEQTDQDAPLDTLSIDEGTDAAREEWREDLGGLTAVVVAGTSSEPPRRAGRLPFGTEAELAAPARRQVELVAVPYYAWANRDVGAMKVFLPVTSALP